MLLNPSLLPSHFTDEEWRHGYVIIGSKHKVGFNLTQAGFKDCALSSLDIIV